MKDMNKAVMAILFSLAAAQVHAQVQVVEAGEGQVQRNRSAAASNNSNELLISMYNQLEALQQEVQLLRGMVEEQAHQLRTLESESRQRYLDIDRRLSSAGSAGADPNAPVPNTGEAETGQPRETQVGDVRTTVPFNPVLQASAEAGGSEQESVLPTLDISQMSEQDLYRTALNLLLEEGNSADAVRLFQNYVDRYPEGRLLPNALYWMGEAYILLARYPQARDAFERVLRDFPEDPKAPGAMYKLGTVFNLMGERALAEQTLRELPNRYPDSPSENTLAREYLDKL